ncbi:uncharacterized protein LOC106884177 [Octopus bimaculoides]|uniref:uncharacterized protein LOC106884177 n=1 Tax=Octopus bimaculoides TaxID=37653 RepID=UPI0022E3B7F4|nr:uncharacterized protein LOC106884177 [Octopus bimaculoides]
MSSHADASKGTDQVDDADCVNSMMANCPNFRRLCPGVRIYRSSRPDLLTDEEAGFFRDQLNIRTIIDLRSVSEYKKATGDKLVANHYNLYKVSPASLIYSLLDKVVEFVNSFVEIDPIDLDFSRHTRKTLLCIEGEPLEQRRISRCSSFSNPDGTPTSRSTPSTTPATAPPSPSPTARQPSSSSQQESSTTDHPDGKLSTTDADSSAKTGINTESGQEMGERRHYLFDIFKSYPRLMFSRAPWYIQLYSMFVLLFDLIWRTGYKNFVRLYVRHVLNPQGILGQYKDMIEIGSTQICAALKLLSSPDNVPALLNCTFGKDRTGVLCALILACLGKDKAYISKNYAQSAALLENVKEVLQDEMTKKYELNETFITAKEQTMMDLLDHIEEKYGSVTEYMEHIGFSREEQKMLCENICR